MRKLEPKTLEIKLKNGKTKVCKDGYEMWKFAIHNDPKMEFKFDEKSGPFLCDYFERLKK